jgi:polyhydroxyalkanoate synthase
MPPSLESQTPPPTEPAPWVDLASHWQQIASEWSRWWMQSAHAVASTPERGTAPSFDVPPALAAGMIEPQALAALNAKFAPRFQALWTQSAFADAGAAADAAPGDGKADAPAKPPMDRRFASREWQDLPYFAFLRDGYLLTSEYLNELAALAPLPPADKHRLAFATRQVVDALSPANFPATNPDVLKRALATEGASFARGAANLVADARKGRITMADEDAFEVGRNLALTPGDVVFRNELIELIQYAPSTGRVHRRPLLIVPPCINKYYILDLQPSNSFVRHAVAAGHTVFLVSWRNIPPELGHVSWDDYLEQGVLAALAVVREVSGSRTVNTLGFCVGGTLLASALAVLAARHDRSVESATFLTTMLDFEDPG